MAIAGMDPLRFLETDDPVERMVMNAITHHYHKRRRLMDRELAAEIINALSKSMKKG